MGRRVGGCGEERRGMWGGEKRDVRSCCSIGTQLRKGERKGDVGSCDLMHNSHRTHSDDVTTDSDDVQHTSITGHSLMGADP